MNDNTSSEGCQQLLKQWLGQCENHVECALSQRSFLPTRLLDLKSVDVDAQIRLVITAEIAEQVHYVTLSHCWGGDVPFQLRQNTLEKMMTGFSITEMPQTFRDAIAVARWANGESYQIPCFQSTMSMAEISWYQYATSGSTHAALYRAPCRTGKERPR